MRAITKKGFTLIEILIVLAISVIVISIVTVSFSKLNSSQAMEKSAALVVSVIDEARARTLSSKDDSSYGVYFQDSELVLFKGVIYSESDPENVSVLINPLVGIRNVLLSGDADSVVFKRLTGNTDQYGTLELFLRSAPGTVYLVNILATGVVEVAPQ